MTSTCIDENIIQCPICLITVVLPITLPCGHTYCEQCIKHVHFRHVKKACPVCRKKIEISISDIQINLMLDRILRNYFFSDKKYNGRIVDLERKKQKYKTAEYWQSFKKNIRKLYPWIIICLLLYHLIRVKINVFNLLFQKYKDKALKLATTIEKQNSLDFKFLLFSQFMRILFSNMIIH